MKGVRAKGEPELPSSHVTPEPAYLPFPALRGMVENGTTDAGDLRRIDAECSNDCNTRAAMSSTEGKLEAEGPGVVEGQSWLTNRGRG